jgi:hypothetical protein
LQFVNVYVSDLFFKGYPLYHLLYISFVIACSHYANIDLVAMSQGYAPGYTDAQLDKIKKAAVSPARILANQIEDEVVP